MYAIDSIAIVYALDDDEPKSGRWHSDRGLMGGI